MQGVQTSAGGYEQAWGGINKHKGYERSIGDGTNEHEASAGSTNEQEGTNEHEGSAGCSNEHRGYEHSRGSSGGCMPLVPLPLSPIFFLNILLLFKHIYIFPCPFNTIFRIF